MKNFALQLLLIFLLGQLILPAQDYQVLVLGDMHYDGMIFHDLSENPPKFHYSPAEVKRNLTNTERWLPRMLPVAAAVTKQAPFVIQVGDLTQGDCGSEALQTQMLESAWRMLKQHFPDKPVYFTPGNHDYRGPGAKKATRSFIAKTMSQESKQQVISPDYVIRHGQDVYIFLDAADGTVHLDFLKAELEKAKNARYKFVIGHYPFLPITGQSESGVFLGKGKEALWEEMFDLLLKHNVIYLCGHMHRNTVIEYSSAKGRVSQLMAFSILSPGPNKPDLEILGPENYSRKLHDRFPRMQKLLEKLQPDVREYFYSRNPGGYTVMNISDQGITADIVFHWNRKPYTTVTLRSCRAATRVPEKQ